MQVTGIPSGMNQITEDTGQTWIQIRGILPCMFHSELQQLISWEGFTRKWKKKLHSIGKPDPEISFPGKPNFVPEISAGFFLEEKDRLFNARNMGYVRSSSFLFDQNLLDKPIDYLFQPENINTTKGIKIDEQSNPSDSYEASNILKAGYHGQYSLYKETQAYRRLTD
jgi:hypothetical protein